MFLLSNCPQCFQENQKVTIKRLLNRMKQFVAAVVHGILFVSDEELSSATSFAKLLCRVKSEKNFCFKVETTKKIVCRKTLQVVTKLENKIKFSNSRSQLASTHF